MFLARMDLWLVSGFPLSFVSHTCVKLTLNTIIACFPLVNQIMS